MSALLSDLEPAEFASLALNAAALLRLDAARGYGLIAGGPTIDPDRCEEVLELAVERGLAFTEDQVVGRALELMAGLNEMAEAG